MMAFTSFLVAYGDNNFFLDRDIDKAKAVKRSVLCVNADQTGFSSEIFSNLCRSHSMEPRTIIVDNAQKVKFDEDLKRFLDDKEPDDRYFVLVAVVRSTKLPPIWESLSTKGKLFHRVKFNFWEKDKFLSFISNEAKGLGVKLELGVPEVLLRYAGMDLYRLYNELQKLSLLVGQSGTISKRHVVGIVSPTPHVDVFTVTEAAFLGHHKKALQALSILVSREGDSVLLPLVYAMMRQVERLLLVKNLQDMGSNESDIITHLETRGKIYASSLKPMSQKHTFKDLVECMKTLCGLDIALKSSTQSKKTLLELLIVSLSKSQGAVG